MGKGLLADSVQAVVCKAIGKFFVFADEGFVAWGVSESFVERAGKRSAFEQFFHDVLGDFGEVVFYDAVDVLPEVAGSTSPAHAENTEVFCPVDGGVFGVFYGLVQEFCKA